MPEITALFWDIGGVLLTNGSWIEQLIAESTGEDGKGIVPVVDEALAAPERYGADRLFVLLLLESDEPRPLEASADALESAGHPVVRLALKERADLGQEFFRWEVAYLAPSDATGRLLSEFRLRLRVRLGVATTLGYGPRFLHSTRQLHKGGLNTGVFLQLVDEPAADLPGSRDQLHVRRADQGPGARRSAGAAAAGPAGSAHQSGAGCGSRADTHTFSR